MHGQNLILLTDGASGLFALKRDLWHHSGVTKKVFSAHGCLAWSVMPGISNQFGWEAGAYEALPFGWRWDSEQPSEGCHFSGLSL